MSRKQRSIATLIGIIILLVAPSAISLLWYRVTGDPLLRPLGITREKLRAYYGTGDWIEIVAEVEWDTARSGNVTRADMERALSNAFRAKGVDVHVVFKEGHSGTRVVYRIGPSVIGPYPQTRAAEGISAAVEAYRMNVPFKP